jgi:hypothetical protein
LPLDEVVPMASTIPASYMGTTTSGTMTAEWDAASGQLQVCGVTP